MLPYLSDRFANASSLHAGAREARKAIEEAREHVATAAGARSPEDVVFTSGGTEADNLALTGAAFRARHSGRTRIVVSAVEHHAVLDTAQWLGRNGFEVSVVGVDGNGVVDLDALRAAVDAKTAIVSVMLANNEVGTIQPAAECAQIAREAGALFHTDAVQAFAWLPVEASRFDLVSLSAHKLGGPKGTGALIRARGVSIEPMQHGGGQERGVRSGTYNVAGIAGFGEAARLAAAERDAAGARVAALRDRIQVALFGAIAGAHVSAVGAARLPGHLHLTIERIDSEPLLLLLDGGGIAASAGSACSSGAAEPSHVLAAMDVPRERARGALRLSLGRETTEAEVDAAAVAIVDAVARLRR